MVSTILGLTALAALLLPQVIAQVNPDESQYGYAFYGCSYDNLSYPILDYNPISSGLTMTSETCVAYCAGHGNYNFVGVFRGALCRCGNVIKPAGYFVADTDCNYTCPGNSSQKCGGTTRISMYHKIGPIVNALVASSSRSYAAASVSSYRSSFYGSKSSRASFVTSSRLSASLSRSSARSAYTSSRSAVLSSKASAAASVTTAHLSASTSRSSLRSLFTSSQQSAITSRSIANSLLSSSRSLFASSKAFSIASSKSSVASLISSSRSVASASRSSSLFAYSTSHSLYYSSKSSLSLAVASSKYAASVSHSSSAFAVSSSRASSSSSLSSYNAYLSSSRSAATALTATSNTTTSNTAYATYPAAVTTYPADVYNPTVFCPDYDNKVAADNRFGTYEYQVFCDAEVDGGTLAYPTGYSNSNMNNMLQCLDVCNIINQNDGAAVCQAVVYQGANNCVLKTNITQQTNTPAGRGHQYNYYVSGYTAAQILDGLYPSPSATKATPSDT